MYFIDIETVPQCIDFEEVDKRTDAIYQRKFAHEFEETESEILGPIGQVDKHYRERAALYAEFGKVACVSVGFLSGDSLRVKTVAGFNEKILLGQVASLIEKAGSICAHNGKEFDFPFLVRRFLINDLEIPKVLNTMGKKPWETNLEDTMEMWKFGQYRHSISLESLCNCFGIPTPKAEIDGADVARLYYQPQEEGVLIFDHEEKVFGPIKKYCAGDVVALVKCYQKLKRLPVIQDEKISYV